MDRVTTIPLQGEKWKYNFNWFFLVFIYKTIHFNFSHECVHIDCNNDDENELLKCNRLEIEMICEVETMAKNTTEL